MTTSAVKSPAEHAVPGSETALDDKVRKCMMCQTEFSSGWAGERVCRKCKASDKWRRA